MKRALAAICIALGAAPSFGGDQHAPYMVMDRATALSPWSSDPRLFAMSDGRLIGWANDRANGYELWTTDGTAA